MLSTSISAKAFKALASVATNKFSSRQEYKYVYVCFLPDGCIFFEATDGMILVRYLSRSRGTICLPEEKPAREVVVPLPRNFTSLKEAKRLTIVVDEGQAIVEDDGGNQFTLDFTEATPLPSDQPFKPVFERAATKPTLCSLSGLARAFKILGDIVKGENYGDVNISMYTHGDYHLLLRCGNYLYVLVSPCCD